MVLKAAPRIFLFLGFDDHNTGSNICSNQPFLEGITKERLNGAYAFL